MKERNAYYLIRIRLQLLLHQTPNLLNEEEFITSISDEDKKFLMENRIFIKEKESAYAIG